jgi:hypothetical protein
VVARAELVAHLPHRRVPHPQPREGPEDQVGGLVVALPDASARLPLVGGRMMEKPKVPVSAAVAPPPAERTSTG